MDSQHTACHPFTAGEIRQNGRPRDRIYGSRPSRGLDTPLPWDPTSTKAKELMVCLTHQADDADAQKIPRKIKENSPETNW